MRNLELVFAWRTHTFMLQRMDIYILSTRTERGESKRRDFIASWKRNERLNVFSVISSLLATAGLWFGSIPTGRAHKGLPPTAAADIYFIRVIIYFLSDCARLLGALCLRVASLMAHGARNERAWMQCQLLTLFCCHKPNLI